MQPRGDRRVDDALHAFREAQLVGIRERADALLEPDGTRDAEQRRRAERGRDAACRVERGVGLDREDDEVRAAHRVLVRRAADVRALETGGRLACASGVSRADHDVVFAERGQPLRERVTEAARAAEDRDLHARVPAASIAAAASRRAAATSLISVRVTTSLHVVPGKRRQVGLVDHERVDQARRSTTRRVPATSRRPAAAASGRQGLSRRARRSAG